MKTKFFYLCLVCIILGLVTPIGAQVAFRHVTNPGNVQGHITRLDHPQLNGNPNALVFIMPNYNTNGADPSGADYQQNAGVYYSGGRWAIFNQNTKAPMPVNLTFNVLVAPAGNANYFSVTCTQNSKAGLAPNGMVIDHPATNNKPNVLLMVTQNWSGTYNDNSPIVSYANGKWYISNNKYLSPDPAISAKSTMPVGARFNVMVITNGVASGFPTAKAFMHTVTPNNILAGGITYFDQPFLNGNTNVMLWATPNWGWSPGGAAGQTSGPYNDSPINGWYDHPTDRWNYKNGYWTIFNNDGTAMKAGAKFNVLAMNVGSISPIPQAKVCIDRFPISFNGAVSLAALRRNLWQNGQTIRIMMNGSTPFIRERVRRYANEWLQYANLRFEYVDREPADIHISFVQDETSWSHIGTDSRFANPSMNYGWFTETTTETEFRRTILHEFGHALGAIHEHQHPDAGIPWDRDAVMRFFSNLSPPWDAAKIEHNIFQRFDRDQTQFTRYDPTSIMHYPINDALTIGSYSVPWNTNLSPNDIALMRTLYPFPAPTQSQIVNPASIGTLCPTRKTRGDAEFGGGPQIQCNVNIQVSADAAHLDAVIYFKAEETGGDYSTVEQTFTQRIWSAPANQRISGITSSRSSTSSRRGTNAGGEGWGGCNDGEILEMPVMGGLVRRIQVIGDTGSGDISGDNDCGCDTQIRRIEFNPITVTLSQR
ncbi:M12 family metallopeptidase [Haliscomenobacter sp.]|uniref:DUF7452 domain-containing protein n=1 Tax=Haliscomenobacter sp. TaxID=2717303 RepID=UPI0035932F1D